MQKVLYNIFRVNSRCKTITTGQYQKHCNHKFHTQSGMVTYAREQVGNTIILILSNPGQQILQNYPQQN